MGGKTDQCAMHDGALIPERHFFLFCMALFYHLQMNSSSYSDNVCLAFSVIIDGQLNLKKDHAYYDQVQGQLYLTNRTCCDFLVWTSKDSQVIRIRKDPAWAQNIGKLIDFYFNVFMQWFN